MMMSKKYFFTILRTSIAPAMRIIQKYFDKYDAPKSFGYIRNFLSFNEKFWL